MCGFAALHGRSAASVSRSQIIKAINAIAYRGPDGEGVCRTPYGVIVHRRLAIRDIAQGAQPMWDNSGRYCLAYNGEIYNHHALSSLLSKQYHVELHTHCDTELLLQGLICEGASFLSRLNGMFALCFLDAFTGELIIARDRYGIKPLFYGQHHGRVAVGSDIDALLALEPELASGWSHSALDHYFTLGYIPSPQTHLSQVQNVNPGQTITITAQGDVSVSQFANVCQRISDDGDVITDEEGGRLLRQAVQSQCVSDVPVGSLLSGGVDSAIVTQLASEHIPTPLHMFTAGFKERGYNESPQASAFASSIGGKHHTVWMDERQIRAPSQVATMFSSPFADNAAYPTYLLSKKASEHVKVILSGDGADELFYGYRNHRSAYIESYIRNKIPPPLRASIIANLAKIYPNHPAMPRCLRARSALTSLSQTLSQSYCWAMSQVAPGKLSSLYTDQFKQRIEGQRAEDVFFSEAQRANSSDPMKIIQHLDFSIYLPGCILTKLDRASMQAGVEARVPFLDNTLVDTVLQQPSQRNIALMQNKQQLRRWSRVISPNIHSRRAKMSFTSPLDTWFRNMDSRLFFEMLLPSVLLDANIFDPVALKKLLMEHRDGRTNEGPFLWSLAMFNQYITLNLRGSLL